MTEILGPLHQSGVLFDQFVQAWFKKMDFITSRESLRINLIAIYTLLPHFSAEMLTKWFPEIGRHTFGQLDNYMYLKLTNSSCRFHSPSKM